MKITPLEIKQRNFTTRSFGKGYDREEVHAFLELISQEWEKKLDENKELQIRAQLLEKENEKLKEVEGSLYRTLRTAEDTSANIVDQARKTAELKVREAQLKADVIIQDARGQAKTIVQKAHARSRGALQDALNELKKQELTYFEMNRQKDSFLLDLQSFAKGFLEKVDKFNSLEPSSFFQMKIKEAQDRLEEKHEFIDQQEAIEQQTSQNNSNAPVSKPQQVQEPKGNANEEANSFFDDVKTTQAD